MRRLLRQATADPQTPAATSVPVLVLGLAMIGSGVALIDTPALPLLAALADNTLGPGVGYGAAAAVEATAMSFGQVCVRHRRQHPPQPPCASPVVLPHPSAAAVASVSWAMSTIAHG
jgi:hypothetical protein